MQRLIDSIDRAIDGVADTKRIDVANNPIAHRYVTHVDMRWYPPKKTLMMSPLSSAIAHYHIMGRFPK